MSQMMRLALAVLVSLVAGVVGTVVALFVTVDEKAVEKAIGDFSMQALHARAEMSGPVEVSRLTNLKAKIPAITFKDSKTGNVIGSIKGADIEVALWAIPLGTVHVQKADVYGLDSALVIPSLSGDALFDKTFGSVVFPDNLKVSDLRLIDGKLALTVSQENITRKYQLTGLRINLGRLSPEASSKFDFSTTLTEVRDQPAAGQATKTAAAAESGLQALGKGFINTESTDPLSGAVSATGTLNISANRRHVMLDDMEFAAELSRGSILHNLVAKADRLRFAGNELSGMNLSATISRPSAPFGDIHAGIVEFSLLPGQFSSPEMRIEYSDKSESRTIAYQLSSAVKADLPASKLLLESFSGKISVKDDPSIPEEFTASLSGLINLDLVPEKAAADLSGSFAGAPFTFKGNLQSFEDPELAGELQVGTLDMGKIPSFKNFALLHTADYNGSLRIGEIVNGPFKATHLSGSMSLKDGALGIENMLVNIAGGRLIGNLTMNDSAAWGFEGKSDSIRLDEFIALFGSKSIASGVIGGRIAMGGSRLDYKSFYGNAEATVVRARYTGIDAFEIRRRIQRQIDDAAITKQGAKTDFDEVTANVTLKDGIINIPTLTARSSLVRCDAALASDIASGKIAGRAVVDFAPQQGVPAMHVNAEFTGQASAPVWKFAWAEAENALAKARGRELITDRPGRSIWQNVREFFKF